MVAIINNLNTGKKPANRPASEMQIGLPYFSFADAPSMPDVPLLPGIDYEKLTAGDPSPLFITRPLAILGQVSGNGLVYDEFLLSEIERQVIAKRPIARGEHVAAEDRAWKNTPSVGLWVGVLRVGDTLYGKCYIRPFVDFNDETRRKEAAGTEISNSIYGDHDVYDNPDGTQNCVRLVLESIDFVPPERAALQALGGDFELTSEMVHEETKMENTGNVGAVHDTEGHQMAETHVRENCSPEGVHEMLTSEMRGQVTAKHLKETATPEETYGMLSDAHKKHVAETYAQEMNMRLAPAEEMRVHEGMLAEMRTVKSQLAEMAAIVKKAEGDAYELALETAVENRFKEWRVRPGSEGEDKLAKYKKTLRTLVIAEMMGAGTLNKREGIEPATEKAWIDYQPIAKVALSEIAGPAAFVGGGTITENSPALFGFDPKTGRYNTEEATKARSVANI